MEGKMSKIESFRDKPFVVADAEARLRNDDLVTFATYKPGELLPAGAKVGGIKCIADGARVVVSEVKIAPTSAKTQAVFAKVSPAAGGAILGWTLAENFAGKFVNETLGMIPKGTDQKGPTAAWEGGRFLRQADLVEIVDATRDIERLTLDMVDPYFAMVTKAASAGVTLTINSGFRSFPEQEILFDGFRRGLPGFNRAAPPGTSPHQNGVALDIAVGGAAGDPVYDWLTENATGFGFVRTVNDEPWHWELRPQAANDARIAGRFKTPNVVDVKFA
jgi:hypothetical protein